MASLAASRSPGRTLTHRLLRRAVVRTSSLGITDPSIRLGEPASHGPGDLPAFQLAGNASGRWP